MLKLSKLTDYAIVLLTYFGQERGPCTARALSERSKLPLPTVSKILKQLCRAELLQSQRGKSGGYTLARSPKEITIVAIIAAIEGPVSLTDCSSTAPGLCEIELSCPVRSNWVKINEVVVSALADLTLDDMTVPAEWHNDADNTLVHLSLR